MRPVGRVALVGAGPGDPGLLTVRGRRLLRRADVVVYDRLVDRRLLDEAPAEALRIDAGKAAGRHALSQAEINALLVDYARRGRRVVRLKGGDPFVFGRGGEEAMALAEAGVPVDIVPGVSAAIAVPACAGIPLTYRALSSSFAVVTGHEAEGKGHRVDWAQLATAVDTLVVLMGAARLSEIARRLIAHGRAAETPVALIRSGTSVDEQTIGATLGEVAACTTPPAPPVVLVIGEVVALRQRLVPAMRRVGVRAAQPPRYARRTWSLPSRSVPRPSRTIRPVSIT